jgi:hypothetical protein
LSETRADNISENDFVNLIGRNARSCVPLWLPRCPKRERVCFQAPQKLPMERGRRLLNRLRLPCSWLLQERSEACRPKAEIKPP